MDTEHLEQRRAVTELVELLDRMLVQASSPKPKPRVEPAPTFPIDCFPPDVRAYVAACADSARVPVEMVAAPFLAFAGSTIGSQIRFDVGNGWIERPVLWIALIALTGAGKSPAITAARQPLDRLQEEAWAEWQPRMREWQTNPDPTGIPPTFDRLYTTDPTMETLVEDLQTSPGICIVRDDLIGVIRAMDQYRSRGGDDRQKYLSLWSHGPLAPSRKSTSGAWVRHPVVSIVGGLQPLVYPGLRSKSEDGFIERFLPILLGIPKRYWSATATTRATPPDVDAMTARFRALRHIPAAQSEPDGLLIHNSPAAATVWATWYNDNVDRTHVMPTPVRGFFHKLPAHVARFALILHALWHPDDPAEPVSEETMIYATRLGEFFRSHILRAVMLLNESPPAPTPNPTLSQRILRILAETTNPDGWVTRTELYLGIGQPPKDDLTKALDKLISENRIVTRKQRRPTAKRPILQYRLAASTV